jgi:hypothetical protein
MNDEKSSVRVFMYLLPYNFPRFFTFLDELKNSKTPTTNWKNGFEKFLRDIPPYYIQPLKIAWKRYNLPPFFPDHVEAQLYNLESYLKKLKKMEKVENEKQTNANKKITAPVIALNSTVEAQNPDLWTNTDNIEEERITLVQEVVVNKNPFDIDRASILNQLRNMSLHLYGIAKETDAPLDEPIIDQLDHISRMEIRKHSVPISQMGNFEQVISKKQILRDPLVDPNSEKNAISFGSPYKNKRRAKKKDVRTSTPTSDVLKDENVTDMNVNEAQVLQGPSDEVEQQKFVGDEMDIVAMERQQLNHQEEINHMFESVIPPAVETVTIEEPKPPEEDENKKKETLKKQKAAKQLEDRVKCIKEMTSVDNGEVIQVFANVPERVLAHMYQRITEIKVPRQQIAQLHKMVRSKRDGRSTLGKRKREEEEEEEVTAVLTQLAEIEFLNPTVEKMYLTQLINTARDFRKKLLADKLKERAESIKIV